MELGLSNTLLAGDPRLIDHIVGEVKSQGIFDQFRKECIADVDTKPAYQNLRTRVEGSVNSFLNKQTWKPDLNKNQLRETLRKHIHDAPYLDAGVERIVDQVVNPKVYSVFMPQIEDVVYKFLGIERPKIKEKNGACGLKDLLPKDLDPVSPESDKNSLKDLSLESVDTNDNLDEKQNDRIYNEQKPQEEMCMDRERVGSENGHISSEEKISDDICKLLNKTGSNSNLNTSGKSDDKMDEEEEDSPTFEPIDIMNLNESNVSNDSHLSGISELTSHRSRSPDFSNELSRDNFDYSNQDSQLSKVSSDSRLSIVTDFGSSNHDLIPIPDIPKDEVTKDKYEAKSNKDNLKVIREFDLSRNKITKSGNFEFVRNKDAQDYKDSKDSKSTKSISSRENSRDATDSGVKDKYEHKNSKEKNKDSEFVKSKNVKEKNNSKDGKYYRDKSNEKKKTSSHSTSVKYDKYNKNKSKEKTDQIRENSEKTKDILENLKDNTNKLKEEKLSSKEMDKRDNINKEAKDLKDLYKEKIRELREKKELTEKEKLNKDKLSKEIKDKKDSSKDKKSSKRDHKSSSSSSSSSKNPSANYHDSKSSKVSTDKVVDGRDRRSESKDKTKRDEKRLSKDNKSKSHCSNKTDLLDKSDKSDAKKIFRSEKEDKVMKVDTKKDVKCSDKTNGKKDAKNHLQSKNSDRNEKADNKKDTKNDSQSKDKKRREDKRSKPKDDHSSLRKNSNDRRSTDRDGSNGSNSKASQSSNLNSNVTNQKSSSSSLTKENQISNSSSETSDSIEETQVNDMKTSHQLNCKLSYKTGTQRLLTDDKIQMKNDTDNSDETCGKQEEADLYQTSLLLKKRQLSGEDEGKPTFGEVKLKKPKFAKNIHEAKRLMKIRKQMERQKVKDDKKIEIRITQETGQTGQSSTTKNADNLSSMPDDERVQIIEIPDEEYDEPYPEKESSLTLDERSILMLGTESCTKDFLNSRSNTKPKLSNIELCIRESLSEIVSDVPFGAVQNTDNHKEIPQSMQSDDLQQRSFVFSRATSESRVKNMEDPPAIREEYKKDKYEFEVNSKNQMPKDVVADDKSSKNTQTEETHESQNQKKNTISKESVFMVRDDKNVEQSIKKNAEVEDHGRVETRNDNEEMSDDNRPKIRDNREAESGDEKQMETCGPSKIDPTHSRDDRMKIRSVSPISEDNEDCRYFKTDDEKLKRFFNFLESLELFEEEVSSLEDMIESLGGKLVCSMSKSMAPPLSKPKRPFTSLSDILVNNVDNNNDGAKQTLSSSNEDPVHGVKRRKLLATKKPRFPSFCNAQGISNGENFVMPLSPDSDVSATSEKIASSNVIKEEKSRSRSSQRYSSDDLYKPRPLFSSSSRRSRRSNQA